MADNENPVEPIKEEPAVVEPVPTPKVEKPVVVEKPTPVEKPATKKADIKKEAKPAVPTAKVEKVGPHTVITKGKHTIIV